MADRNSNDPPQEDGDAPPGQSFVVHNGTTVTHGGQRVVHNLTSQGVTTGLTEVSQSSVGVQTDAERRDLSGGWGQGLTDREACEKLKAMMVNVATGQRHVAEDRTYERFRAVFMRKPHLKSRSPRLLLKFDNLNQLQAFVRAMPRDNRVPEVESDWLPLMHWFASLGDGGAHDASAWTGTRDAYQHARTIRRVTANALIVVDRLLSEADARFGNGGPLDPPEQEALDTLREFRDALTGLIKCLEAAQPVEQKIAKVQSLGQRALTNLANHLKSDGEVILPLVSMLSISGMVAALAPLVSGATFLPEATFVATSSAYLKLRGKQDAKPEKDAK